MNITFPEKRVVVIGDISIKEKISWTDFDAIRQMTTKRDNRPMLVLTLESPYGDTITFSNLERDDCV